MLGLGASPVSDEILCTFVMEWMGVEHTWGMGIAEVMYDSSWIRNTLFFETSWEALVHGSGSHFAATIFQIK